MSRLERWSQRKRRANQSDAPAPSDDDIAAVNAADEQPVDSPTPGDAATGQTPAAEARSDARPADDPPAPGSLDESLPDPESLPAGSDFSVFMATGVSSALRRRALKRLWSTGNYNVRDGLDDYDADYRQTLKPMAEGMADTLRRWTHKVEETLDSASDEATEAAPGDEPHESAADKPIATAPEKTDNRHVSDVNERAGQENSKPS